MKPELNLLVWAVALTVVQMLVAAQAAFNKVGLMALVGNREGLPELTGWGGRARDARAPQHAREPGAFRRPGAGGGDGEQDERHDAAGRAALHLGAACV